MFISIPESDYLELLDDQKKLYALEAAGICNWEGYDYAMELLREAEGD